MDGLGETEVEHLDCAGGSDLDVRGLQVAVDNPLLVRGFERLDNLSCDGKRLVYGNGTTPDAIGKRFTFDQFHDDRSNDAGTLQPVDLSDVRVVQGGEHTRFAREALEAVGVVAELRCQDFDRDIAVQLGSRAR